MSTPISMDFPPNRLSFFAFLTIYTRLFYVIFVCSFVLSVFTADLRLTACYFLATSAVLCLLHNALMAFYYERYLHTPASYTFERQFCLIFFGIGALALFAIGLLGGVAQLVMRN